MKIEYIETSKLVPYVNNTRTHTDEQIKQVASSVKEFGFLNPIIIDKDNGIIAGHCRVLACDLLDMEEVPCIRAEHLTEAQKKAYIIADNKLAENAGWDNDLLKIEIENLKELDFDIDLLGFDDIELDNILGIDEEEQEIIEDEVPEVPEEPKSKLGQIYQLGNHRLMCGDSTNEEDVKKLMNGQLADMVFTDPPYGVFAAGGRSQTKEKLKMKAIENDDLQNDNLIEFLYKSFKCLFVKEDASIYICYPWATQKEFTLAIEKANFKIKQCIIWDKKVFGLNGHKGYRPQYEMIYFVCKNDFQWFGDKGQSNIWQISREIKREEQGNHPTPKPIELICKALKNSSKSQDIVVDLFGGSGSTLIACEQLNRNCYMMELDPKYIDVIITRWENLTGERAILLEE